MTLRRRGPVAALAAVLTVALSAGATAGCAGSSPGARSGASSGASSGVPESTGSSEVPPTDPSAAPSASYGGGSRPPVVPPVKPRPGGGPRLLSGTVSAGVEPNCLILDTGTERYVLLTRDPQLRAATRPGTRVAVTGTVRPDLVTTCQQGTPLEVTAVRGG